MTTRDEENAAHLHNTVVGLVRQKRLNNLLIDLLNRGLNQEDIRRYYAFLYAYHLRIPRNDDDLVCFSGVKPLHGLLSQVVEEKILRNLEKMHPRVEIGTFLSKNRNEHVKGMSVLLKKGLVVKAPPSREIEIFPNIYTPAQIQKYLKFRAKDKALTYQPAHMLCGDLSFTHDIVQKVPCLVLKQGHPIAIQDVMNLLWMAITGVYPENVKRRHNLDIDLGLTMHLLPELDINSAQLNLLINWIHGGKEHETKGYQHRKQ